MTNLIEVEVENKSYIELLNLTQNSNRTLKLTTLEDNQGAVIIKIFLNRSGNRILLKEFYIHNLKPEVSGLPRFRLSASYHNKLLELNLTVDGVKTDHLKIKLAPYLRNKLLPLFIISGVFFLLILILGSKWLLETNSFRSDYNMKRVNIEQENLNTPNNPISTTKNNLDIKDNTEKPEAVPVEKGDEQEARLFEYTAYFLPNDTNLTVDTLRLLNDIVIILKAAQKAKIEISGHCAMTGTKEGRDRLSKERAYKVLDYLKKKGWGPAEQPKIKWYGGTQPVTTDPNEIYKNRRVEIEIVLP